MITEGVLLQYADDAAGHNPAQVAAALNCQLKLVNIGLWPTKWNLMQVNLVLWFCSPRQRLSPDMSSTTLL